MAGDDSWRGIERSFRRSHWISASYAHQEVPPCPAVFSPFDPVACSS
jgi:hypothetical protein